MEVGKRGVWISMGLAFLIPASASAGNGQHPRTPVVWEGAPCLQLVDRSDDPVMHLPYDIPFEDTEVGPDEVENSRTHQFLAFCRRKHPQDQIPNWITMADVDAAVQMMLIQADSVDPEDVLETSTAWEGCWFRINGDDERRPITTQMADEGVDWDTTDLDPGAYTIYGYTYEPAFNLWIVRPSVIKVHDGDPAGVGPAAWITNEEEIVYNGSTTPIEGCVDTIDGTTLTAYYANTDDGDQPSWVPFAEDQPVEGDSFSVDFDAPEEIVGGSAMIRVDFDDPQGRSYTAYMEELVIILEGNDPDACNETGGSFIAGPGCDDGGSGSTGGNATSGTTGDSAATTGAATDGSGTTDPGQTDGGGGSGCSCTSGSPIAPASLLALPLLAFVTRRRRS